MRTDGQDEYTEAWQEGEEKPTSTAPAVNAVAEAAKAAKETEQSSYQAAHDELAAKDASAGQSDGESFAAKLAKARANGDSHFTYNGNEYSAALDNDRPAPKPAAKAKTVAKPAVKAVAAKTDAAPVEKASGLALPVAERAPAEKKSDAGGVVKSLITPVKDINTVEGAKNAVRNTVDAVKSAAKAAVTPNPDLNKGDGVKAMAGSVIDAAKRFGKWATTPMSKD